LVTLEAMKEGIPVIGTKSGGTLELIEDGLTGFFYKPGDYNELSDKIKYFYDNHDKLREMGHNAKILAKSKFTPEKYVKMTLKVLSDVIS
jgi:glycosyltransferase involved in cell wall biosynthesis